METGPRQKYIFKTFTGGKLRLYNMKGNALANVTYQTLGRNTGKLELEEHCYWMW
jgi:hypothetical protein